MIKVVQQYVLMVNMNNFQFDNHQEVDYKLDNEHWFDDFEE
jgi:hypothetical protein